MFYLHFTDDEKFSFSGIKVDKPLLCQSKYGLKVNI